MQCNRFTVYKGAVFNLISDILTSYNQQIEDSEICYKNTIDNQHYGESVSRSHITAEICEIECYCNFCNARKYVYDCYILEEGDTNWHI